MLPATIAICRKFCSLQAKQKRCSDLNAECVIKIEIKKCGGYPPRFVVIWLFSLVCAFV